MAGAPTAALLGVTLLLAGAGFDSPSLLVPGVGLLGLALAAVAWVQLARPRRVVRGAAPARVVEGEPYPVRIMAVGGRLPPPGGRLTDSVLPAPVSLGPRWKGTHSADIALHGRGRRRLGPARLEVSDPLGLWSRAVESEDPGELLVLPRVEPVLTAGRGAGGRRPSTLAGLEDGAAALAEEIGRRAFVTDGDRCGSVR